MKNRSEYRKLLLLNMLLLTVVFAILAYSIKPNNHLNTKGKMSFNVNLKDKIDDMSVIEIITLKYL